MENQNKKCSQKKHSDINAVIYCVDCKRYLCNKCKNNHSELFEDHQFCNLDKNANDFFTGMCNENNHNIPLEYFCRNHNKLCCAACVTKIEGEGKGQHANCNINLLKEIKDEKVNNLNKNIKILENLYSKLEKTINDIKSLFQEINKKKEDLKLKIQKIFTKLRCAIDEREKNLLIDVENEYNRFFIHEDVIVKSEKLPNKIKSALEKGKIINEGKNNNIKLNMLINDCINVENSAHEINEIYDLIEKCNLNKNMKILFNPDDNGINKFISEINSFGGIVNDKTNIKINSKILSELDMNKIQNWLKESLGDVKIKRYELIYRATEHGDSINTSLQKCKNKSNLLWIMKNKNNNNVFGCFNSIPMSTNNTYSQDMKCFLFSLNKNKKYKPNLDINIYNCSSHCIEFGYNSIFEFSVGDKFLSTASVSFANGQIFQHQLEISDFQSSLSLSELEVFRLIE